jgi:hypothetical protein
MCQFDRPDGFLPLCIIAPSAIRGGKQFKDVLGVQRSSELQQIGILSWVGVISVSEFNDCVSLERAAFQEAKRMLLVCLSVIQRMFVACECGRRVRLVVCVRRVMSGDHEECEWNDAKSGRRIS